MRLSTSLVCTLFSASLLVAACGGTPAEEEGSAARPDDGEGDAGTGGTSGKGGSAGKGGKSGASGKGGSSGKGGATSKGGSGGTGEAAGTGGAGGAAGTGGSGGSNGGSGGAAGSAGASGGGGGSAGKSGSGGASAGNSGSAGTSAAGQGGGAGTSGGAAGSSGGSGGSSAGSGGSSAGSGGAGNGGSAGASTGGSNAGGSAGSGGAVVCTDGYGKNQSMATAFKLNDMDDGSDAQMVNGKVAKGETDWYKYNGTDVAGLHKVKPNVEWTAQFPVTVCVYASKDADWTNNNCSEGDKVTLGDLRGCCAKTKIAKVTDFNNDALIFVSVTRPADAVGGVDCTTYDLAVKYGTGLLGAPQPGDGSEPSPSP